MLWKKSPGVVEKGLEVVEKNPDMVTQSLNVVEKRPGYGGRKARMLGEIGEELLGP